MRELIYTDGACNGNGTKNAIGGFGIYIAKSSLMYDNIKLNKKGTQMTVNFETNKEVFNVTNIRMEGLAIISTLALYEDLIINRQPNNISPLVRLNSLDPFNINGMKFKYDPSELKVYDADTSTIDIEIVTDSLFWMNVVNTWMPSWIRKSIAMTKKNPDILLLFHYYLERLRQNSVNVIFTHVKSHQKGTRSTHADGNDIADILATSAVTNSSTLYIQK